MKIVLILIFILSANISLCQNGYCLDSIIVAGYNQGSTGRSRIADSDIIYIHPKKIDQIDCVIELKRRKKRKIYSLYCKYINDIDTSSYQAIGYKIALIIYYNSNSIGSLAFPAGTFEYIYVDGYPVRVDYKDVKIIQRCIPRKCRKKIMHTIWKPSAVGNVTD